jgi:hypothetical protein
MVWKVTSKTCLICLNACRLTQSVLAALTSIHRSERRVLVAWSELEIEAGAPPLLVARPPRSPAIYEARIPLDIHN